MHRYFRNLRFALVSGLALAAACSALVLLISLVTGSARLGSGDGVDVLALILAYFIGGASAGLVAGLLLPLARSAAGAALVGALTALPLYGAMIVSQHGLRSVRADHAIGLGLAALFVGAPAGLIWREIFTDDQAAKPDD